MISPLPNSINPMRSAEMLKMPSSAVRFGRGIGMGSAIDKGFNWVEASRTRELIVEDLVGFGLLRTGMDLFRGYFYGNDEKLNIPMARERLVREVASVGTDILAPGFAALGLGWIFDKAKGGFSNSFINFSTLDLVKNLSKGAKSEDDVLKALAKTLSENEQSKGTKVSAKGLQDILKSSQSVDVKTRRLAKALNQTSFDVRIKGESFKLNELLEDFNTVAKNIRKSDVTQAKPWGKAASQIIAKTMRSKRLKLLGLSAGVVSTVSVPVANHWLTRKIDGSEKYPGEMGLLPESMVDEALPLVPSPSLKVGVNFQAYRDEQQSWRSQRKEEPSHFGQYVGDSFRQGNPLPALAALAPLPFAVGLFNTVSRRFVNPFKKGGAKMLRNMYDFSKGAPFTTQQQVASLFAVLISSRLANSRSDNEFRERLVDSGLGWAIWILATPVMKEQLAKRLDPEGQSLWKTVGGRFELRNHKEVEALLPKAQATKAISTLKKISRGSMLVTMGLLGVVEPYIAMMWTKQRSMRVNGTNAANEATVKDVSFEAA